MEKNRFKHIYELETPIEFWQGAVIAEPDDTEKVLASMPGIPENSAVYRLTVFSAGNCGLIPVWLCKGNSGRTTYIFSNSELDYSAMRKIK